MGSEMEEKMCALGHASLDSCARAVCPRRRGQTRSSSALPEPCPCVASSECLPALRSAAGWLPAGLPWENSVSPLKSRCPRALVRRTSSVACRVGTWLWPWVAARSLREIADAGTWTLEDTKMVLIVLTKTKRDAANCWTSLLGSEYAADPWVQDQTQRKFTLERFQKENPGFDFSGAEISGNHTKRWTRFLKSGEVTAVA